MRLKVNCIGDIRIVKRFALFPIRILREKYWLQTVYIKQKYEDTISNCGTYSEEWEDIEFVTKEEYLKYKRGNRK